MFLAISKKLVANEKMLCELDGQVGDGDHGATVARGFTEVKKKLEEGKFSTPAEVAEVVGHTLTVSMGGAIGPVLGSFFQAGTKKLEALEDWEAEEFRIMFEKGLERIQLIGGAKEGDRTLVDALAPACRVMAEACEEHLPLVTVAATNLV